MDFINALKNYINLLKENKTKFLKRNIKFCLLSNLKYTKNHHIFKQNKLKSQIENLHSIQILKDIFSTETKIILLFMFM